MAVGLASDMIAISVCNFVKYVPVDGDEDWQIALTDKLYCLNFVGVRWLYDERRQKVEERIRKNSRYVAPETWQSEEFERCVYSESVLGALS